MQHSTVAFFNALDRRPIDRLPLACLVIALASMVVVVGPSTDLITGRASHAVAATAQGSPDPIPVDRNVAPIPIAERTNATAEDDAPSPVPASARAMAIAAPAPVEPPPALGPAMAVPDPRPGDLRIDSDADVLPADYSAAPAAEILRDRSYGPDEMHLLDLYLPGETNPPVVVFLHSGGWVAGDRTTVPEFVLRFLERGYAIASVEYRLAPDHPFPAPIHDVKRAVRELKAIGAETGLVDGERIVLYGTSAGGHLAAFVAATAGVLEPAALSERQAAHDSSVAGIVVAVGPTDLVQLYGHDNPWAGPLSAAHAGCRLCTLDELEAPSVANHLHADLPPAYWAYGAHDPLVDAELQGRVLADAWGQAAGSEASQFDLVDDGGHNLDGTLMNQRRLEAFVDAVAGLRPTSGEVAAVEIA